MPRGRNFWDVRAPGGVFVVLKEDSEIKTLTDQGNLCDTQLVMEDPPFYGGGRGG